MMNLAVLGAGVVGLTTAVELQKEFHGSTVTIIADKFNEDTTSHVAAGIFRPGTGFSGPTEEITQKWIDDAYNYWDDIRRSPESFRAGITQLSGYIFSSQFEHLVKNHRIERLVPLYRSATEDELELCPGKWKYGSFFTTLLTQSSLYLPWALRKFEKAGGRVIVGKINSFSELTEKYDVIVNCTGLGAKFLCDDHKLVPLRGQVLKVEAPWIKTFFYGDYDTYVIPGFDSVTLGGCRQYDSYNTHVNVYDGHAIKERCEALVPSLKTAKVVAQRVGLRPHRETVRVEKETLSVNGGRIKIVHQYGHGGYGVTTAPGTALHSVRLVRELHTGNSKL